MTNLNSVIYYSLQSTSYTSVGGTRQCYW